MSNDTEAGTSNLPSGFFLRLNQKRTLMTYSEKLKDPRWQKKRLAILNAADFTCQWCNNKTKTLHVHHFYYNKDALPWEYEDWDLCCVCEDCHAVSHLKNIPHAVQDALCTMQISPVENGTAIQILNHYLLKYYK